VGQRGGTVYFKIEPSILGSLHCFFFFLGVMGQSNWHVAKKKKSKELGRHPWEVQSCSQGALVFFLLSFGFRAGRLEGRFFFVKLYLVWRVDFPCKFYWGRRG
jgi:hypothetical protein